MSNETSESLLAAAAVVRANLAAMHDPARHQAAFETLLLEVTTHDSPEHVLSGLATIASGAITGLAQAMGVTPDQVLDSLEKHLREEQP